MTRTRLYPVQTPRVKPTWCLPCPCAAPASCLYSRIEPPLPPPPIPPVVAPPPPSCFPTPSPPFINSTPSPLSSHPTITGNSNKKKKGKKKKQESIAYLFHKEVEMVAGFRRSRSLPGRNPSSPGPKGRAPREKACHVRSTSLPCRSHPAIAGLEDEIRALRAWLSLAAPESGSPTWISAGLARIDLLHASLDDLLQLPQAQDQLRRPSSAPCADRLLDDFLRFADAYGSLRSALMSLKQTQSELHTAIRRRDEARLVSSLRSHKRIEKDLAKLAVLIREASRSPAPALAAEVEMAGIMREVTVATAAASAAVFLGIGAVSSAASAAVASTSRASSWVVAPLRKLSLSPSSSLKKRDWGEWDGGALERLEALEECIEALESKSQRVFRSLVNTRVSLLNVLTPSL